MKTFASLLSFTLIILAVAFSSATPTTPVLEAVDSWPQYQLVTTEKDAKDTPIDFSKVRVVNMTAGEKMKANEYLLISGQYAPSMFSVGWNFLKVDTTPLSDYTKESGRNKTQEFLVAGFLEGYLTHLPIQQKNTSGFWDSQVKSPEMATWMDAHIDFQKSESAKKIDDAYWGQVNAVLGQVQGVADGYNRRAADEKLVGDSITFKDVFAQSFQEEFADVQAHLNQKKKFEETGVWPTEAEGPLRPSHCSAVVTAAPNDAYLSHVSWNVIQSALRIYKIYNFIDVAVSFSSYPAVLFSLDDFYETSHSLAIFETSLVVFNQSMYNDFPSSTVSEFIRVMTASYLATDCKTWPNIFIRENNGCYNNEYICMNWKQFPKPDGTTDYVKNIPDWTVSIIDQLPGYYSLGDGTPYLREHRFIPSYNIPFWKDAYLVAGNQFQPMPFWSFGPYSSEYARSKLFRHHAPEVRSMEDFQHLMRWNKFQTDPDSVIQNCSGCPNDMCNPKSSAMLAIACRGDLNPVGFRYNYGPAYQFLNQRNHFAIDSKVSTLSSYEHARAQASKDENGNTTMLRNFPASALIISGPTNDDQPSFQITKAPYENWEWRDAPPAGMPDLWDFPWVRLVPTKADDFPYPSGSGNNSDNSAGEVLGAVFAAFGLFALFSLIAFYVHSRKRLKAEERTEFNEHGIAIPESPASPKYNAVQ